MQCLVKGSANVPQSSDIPEASGKHTWMAFKSPPDVLPGWHVCPSQLYHWPPDYPFKQLSGSPVPVSKHCSSETLSSPSPRCQTQHNSQSLQLKTKAYKQCERCSYPILGQVSNIFLFQTTFLLCRISFSLSVFTLVITNGKPNTFLLLQTQSVFFCASTF